MSVKAREFGTEVSATAGGFARNFATFQEQQGAVAVMLDYRHTAFNSDLWAFRPVIAQRSAPKTPWG